MKRDWAKPCRFLEGMSKSEIFIFIIVFRVRCIALSFALDFQHNQRKEDRNGKKESFCKF